MNFIIADNSIFFRNLFKKRLSILGHHIIGEAVESSHLFDLMSNTNADYVLIDINMRPISGLDIAIEINQLYPKVKIICSTQFNICSWVPDLKQIGVCGYIYKTSSTRSLHKAIESSMQNIFYIDNLESVNLNNIIENNSKNFTDVIDETQIQHNRIEEVKNIYDFTPTSRDLKILSATAEGKPLKQIADILNTSERNISKIKERMRKKVGVATNAELLSLAHKCNWI